MAKLSRSDLRRAHLVPSSVFVSPNAVLALEGLSHADKIRILRRWEFDVRANLRSAPRPRHRDEPGMLDEVLKALAALDVAPPAALPFVRPRALAH